jgi:mannose-6-phosphate isomerase-like protein (cupin superfamily)
MKRSIRHLDPDSEFYTQEKCFITEVSNSDADPGLSIARARVAPGVTTRWHRLKETAERYVIVSGEGRVEIGDLIPQRVGPGDVVLIPPLCRQRITNTGDEDLVFLAICTPRFAAAVYEDLETPDPSGPGAGR